MGVLTFSINVTLDGCVDHQEGIADDETRAFFHPLHGRANTHHLAGDLRTGVQALKMATPAGVLLGSGTLATELDRLNLIDEYQFLVHPRLAGHRPPLYQGGLPPAAQH